MGSYGIPRAALRRAVHMLADRAGAHTTGFLPRVRKPHAAPFEKTPAEDSRARRVSVQSGAGECTTAAMALATPSRNSVFAVKPYADCLEVSPPLAKTPVGLSESPTTSGE